MLYKIENRLKKKNFFIKIYRENRPCILQMNLFLVWEILTDMLAGILMDLRRFMEDLVSVKEIRSKRCY